MKLSNGHMLFAMFLIALAATNLFSQKDGKSDRKSLLEAEKRAKAAASAFREIMGDPDRAIPRQLLDRAEAVTVFPGIIKAAFIIGGRGGEGIILRRTATGWSAPAFFNLGGGSFGAQIGADKLITSCCL